MSSSFCLACASDVSSHSPWLTPCCSTPICSTCLSRNPRLKEYIPCLRCGDVRTEIGNQSINRGREEVQRRREEEERAVFSIGDEDEGEGKEGSPPPGYEEIADDATGDRTGHRSLDAGPGLAADREADGAGEITRPEVNDEEMEIVEVKHPVAKGDTILSIARRYAADPHHLLQLNFLPPSVLSTQPHLLRTRRTLLISRHSIPKSSLPDPTLFSTSLLPHPSPSSDPDTEKREKERAVKRFQLITKTVDPGVGAAYLGLSEMDEERDLLDEFEVEGEGGGGGGGKKVMREEGNREERALEAFWEDEGWENNVGAPPSKGKGRWKSVGSGENMGIKV